MPYEPYRIEKNDYLLDLACFQGVNAGDVIGKGRIVPCKCNSYAVPCARTLLQLRLSSIELRAILLQTLAKKSTNKSPTRDEGLCR